MKIKKFKVLNGRIAPFMTVDPGLNGTGWVVFQNMQDPRFRANGVINIRNGDWDSRAIDIACEIYAIACELEVRKIYCEYPAYFDSAAGQMVAKRGDLLKLTFLVGCLKGISHPMRFSLLPVNTWKGQLPKEVVKKRIQRILGDDLCKRLKSHDVDACGMGLFLQGHMQ
jgi:hypothetical protein